jgi:alpha-beta hydrolase superfamily lysophospholipase
MTTTTAGYLDGCFVTAHLPTAPSTGTGVLLVPPYGWDEAASYRARRLLADQLAAAGHLALRLDLPGTGDSAGDLGAPGLVASWKRAVARAVDALRVAGCARVVGVGLGIGGLLVAGADIDALVVWGTPAHGRISLRELRAFARLERGNSQPPDGLHVYGSHLPQQALDDLADTDLTAGAPAERLRRALILDRDGLPADRDLYGWLAGHDVQVEVDAGRGWGDLMVEPHRARTPTHTLDQIVAWIGSEPHVDGPAVGAPALEHTLALAGLRERVVELSAAAGSAPAVLAEPSEPRGLTVVMLNAGALRRTGPHRAWVDAARRWAASGVTSLRVDLGGIGDADGPAPGEGDLYGSEYVVQVRAVLDDLEAHVPDGPVVLMGLCSGAYWSFQVGQDDPRVTHVVLLNPKALVWHPTRAPLEASRELRKLLHPSSWRRLFAGDLGWASARTPVRAGLLRLRRLPWELVTRWRQASARRAGHDPVVAGFDRLAERGATATLLFSAEETLRAELEHTGVLATLSAHRGVALHLLDGDVETHTCAPADVRRQVDQVVDAAIAQVIA